MQSRAFPTYHRGLARVEPVSLELRSGSLQVTSGSLRSLVYGSQATREIDLTELLRQELGDDAPMFGDHHVPELAWARLRVLSTASMVLAVAFRHSHDLTGSSLHDICDLDASFARQFRDLSGPALAELFHELLTGGELIDPRPSIAMSLDRSGAMLAMSRSARYNCHLVVPTEVWKPDGRTSAAEWVDSTECSVLLPYTYQWRSNPDADVEDVLALLEPLDLVVAQRSVLGAAADESVGVLERLTDTAPADVGVGELRQHLDRVRISYQRLDAYRYDSSQRDRGLYLAARHEIALDEIHQRTETVLSQASESLRSVVEERSDQLDRGLNRLAAVFTVAASGSLVLQAVEFADPGATMSQAARYATLLAVLVVSIATVGLVFVLVSRRRRATPVTISRRARPRARRS